MGSRAGLAYSRLPRRFGVRTVATHMATAPGGRVVDIDRELELGGLMVRSPEQRESWAAAAGPAPAPAPAPASSDELVFERFTPANGGRQLFRMKFDGTNVRALSGASTF